MGLIMRNRKCYTGKVNINNQIDRPDLWVVDTEYNFGGGLYGKRVQKTVTHASVTTSAVTPLGMTGAQRIVSFGGDFAYANARLCVPYCDVTSSSVWIFAMPQISADGEIKMYSKTNSASALTWQFDVWFLYTKV